MITTVLHPGDYALVRNLATGELFRHDHDERMPAGFAPVTDVNPYDGDGTLRMAYWSLSRTIARR